MREHEIETMTAEINVRRNEEEARRSGDPSILRDDDEEDYHEVSR